MTDDGAAGGVTIVAKYLYPLEFSLAESDLRILRHYRRRFRRVFLLIQSPDRLRHTWEEPGLIVQYLPAPAPGLLGVAWFVLAAAWEALRLARRGKVGVVDASDLAGAFSLIPASWLMRIPLLVQLQFPFFEMPPLAYPRWKRLAFRLGARIACRWATSIRCVSEYIRQQAIRSGVDPTRLLVIRTRCDAELFDPSRFDPPPAHDGLGPRLVYVGSLTRRKGVHVLIDALPRILSSSPGCRLSLVGGGPALAELRRQAALIGVQDAVEFVGSVQHSDLPLILSRADIFVFPSFCEGLPRAVLEAMAMELPVIGSRIGGMTEIVQDGREGLLVPAGDAQSLATAVVSMLEDPATAARWGRNGRARVLKEFTFEENVRALVEWHANATRAAARPRKVEQARAIDEPGDRGA